MFYFYLVFLHSDYNFVVSVQYNVGLLPDIYYNILLTETCVAPIPLVVWFSFALFSLFSRPRAGLATM